MRKVRGVSWAGGPTLSQWLGTLLTTFFWGRCNMVQYGSWRPHIAPYCTILHHITSNSATLLPAGAAGARKTRIAGAGERCAAAGYRRAAEKRNRGAGHVGPRRKRGGAGAAAPAADADLMGGLDGAVEGRLRRLAAISRDKSK